MPPISRRCRATMETFVSILCAEAGNQALRAVSTGVNRPDHLKLSLEKSIILNGLSKQGSHFRRYSRMHRKNNIPYPLSSPLTYLKNRTNRRSQVRTQKFRKRGGLVKILPDFSRNLAICHLIHCFHSLDEVSYMIIF